jgi:hypothetical protein
MSAKTFQACGRLHCVCTLLAVMLSACSKAPLTPAQPAASKKPAGQTTEGFTPQRPEFEQIARRLEASDNEFLGKDRMKQVHAQLADPKTPEHIRLTAYAKLAQDLLNQGDVDAALKQVQIVFDTHDPVPDPAWYTLRGLIYLRQAELSNCIQRHNRECCIFPLQGGGIHSVPEPAARAKADYLTYLKMAPDDLTAKWLLNIVAMATADWPQGVPPEHRLPDSAFNSEYDIKRFTDIAPDLGLDTFNLSGGAIGEDFSGDGLLDIITSNSDPMGPLKYFINQGDGTFTDASTSSHTDDQLGGLNVISGDYDNDGDIDLYVLRGAWLMDNGRIRDSLLRNNGDNTFTDVTRAAGIADPACPDQDATWLDYDNDGDLDLYVGNESRRETDLEGRGDYPSNLWRNNGDGTFTDVARSAGVTNDRYAKGVTAGDYDNDGDSDIYVSNAGRNRLYRNNGDGTFTDVAPQAGVIEPSKESFATWFFDYNNDGWLDIFVVAFNATVADVCANYMGLPDQASRPCLYRNNRDGTFTDMAKQMGLDHPYLPMGSNFGDLDNDGFLDIYLATGQPGYQILMPKIMLRNDAGRTYQDVTFSGGFGHLQKGHGVSFADIDNDGDQDVYMELGGFFYGDRFRNALFLNPGHGNNFITIKLVGEKTNRSAVGARIKVSVSTPDGSSEFHRAVGSVSSFGGSPLRQEIGLGKATAIEKIEVYWPVSGQRQVFTDVPVNAMIRITEGHAAFERLDCSAISLNGAPKPESENSTPSNP